MHRFPSLGLKSRIDAAVGKWRSAGGTILLRGSEEWNRTRTSSLLLRPLQAEPFFFAATKIRIGCGRLLPQRLLQANPFSFDATEIRLGRGPLCRHDHRRRNNSPLRQRKIESDAEGRCRDGRCRRAIPHCCDDGAAVIPKFTLSNQESLQCKMRFQAKSCIDSQVWA